MYARKERLRIEKIEDELRRDVELMSEWSIPTNEYEIQDLKNRIANDDFESVFEKHNAINWLKINGCY